MENSHGENALSMLEQSCFICNGIVFDKRTSEYRRCVQCGHEILIQTQAQGFILNDPLDEKDARQQSSLDRFKAKILMQSESSVTKHRLLDIGSASGKFLLHNAARYEQAFGLEVTPAALAFSRDVLGLNIVTDIEQVPAEVSAATAWHSLEHIPEQALLNILTALSGKMINGAQLIVSVPNGASRQYRWFGSAYAYFDVPNHLHQFTTDSLTRLLSKFGFHSTKIIDSRPYNTFGYTQSLLNIITNTHNYLYYRLKRRSRKPSLLLDFVHVLLLPVLVPLGWTLGLLDTADKRTQGVITICFEKKTC